MTRKILKFFPKTKKSHSQILEDYLGHAHLTPSLKLGLGIQTGRTIYLTTIVCPKFQHALGIKNFCGPFDVEPFPYPYRPFNELHPLVGFFFFFLDDNFA
jgi:hypothetical protein